MPFPPLVSVVIPLFNEDESVAAALDSCLAQTLADIEIICIDDASTDATVAIVEEYCRRDKRIRLLRQPANLSAFQARRVGVAAAAAPFILFLDGDDGLAPDAARCALSVAERTGADVVGFGIDVVASHGTPTDLLEDAVQPRSDELLSAPAIIPALFPAGEPTPTHLWRYLFAAPSLRAAYDAFPDDVAYHRANDFPIAFLALLHARQYASTTERLYRFRPGRRGHAVDDLAYFRFLLSGIDPITIIAPAVRAIVERAEAPEPILDSYESARLYVISNILRDCVNDTGGTLQSDCIELLIRKVGAVDTLRAAARFCTEALPALSRHAKRPSRPASPVRTVLLAAASLATDAGSPSAVIEHAALLVSAGYRVAVAVNHASTSSVGLPVGVVVEQLEGELSTRLNQWLALCQDQNVDMVIDHRLEDDDTWPWFALMALAARVPTIGWLNRSALRPIFDQNERTSFLAEHMRILHRIVARSTADVAFWKMLGLDQTVWMPDQPSPLATIALSEATARTFPVERLELAWWGRLNRSTDQVHHLVEVASALRNRDIDFRLTIIGPNSRSLTAKDIRRAAIERGVDGRIELVSEQTPIELFTLLADSHMMVSTTKIDGSHQTVLEAQALGMPVATYDMPWLARIRDLAGIVATPPDDPALLADAIADIAREPERLASLSRRARDYAQKALATDSHTFLVHLLADEMPSELSPHPSPDEASALIKGLVRYAERNIRSSHGAQEKVNSELSRARQERLVAERALKHTTESPSFRAGRALTLLPRKARELVRPSAKAPDSLKPATPATQIADVAAYAITVPPLRPRPGQTAPERSATPDVTFVIPVYNSELWLDDCLSSVLAQTGVDVEVICIDDGSTDNSRAALHRFADLDPRVTVIEQANSGQSIARNRGLAAATGRYVIYLDSDDYWPNDALNTLVQRADRDALEVLFFDCFSFLDGEVENAIWQRYATYYQRTYTYPQVRSGIELMAAMRQNKEYRPHVGMYMTRTTYLQSHGLQFVPGIVHQDNPYTFRLLLDAARAAHIRLDAYARRVRPGSTITALNADRSARGYYLSYLEMTRSLTDRKLPAHIEVTVNAIIESVYESARAQFSLISDETAKDLQSIDLRDDAQAVFRELSAPRN